MRPAWSFSMHMQKLGGNAMLVDAEHAFDPAYSKALGVDVENLIVCQPDHGEMALESNIFLSMWLFENWCDDSGTTMMLMKFITLVLDTYWFWVCHLSCRSFVQIWCHRSYLCWFCLSSNSTGRDWSKLSSLCGSFTFWIDKVAHVWLIFSLYRVRLGCSKWVCKHALWAKLCVRCQEMPQKLVVHSFFWIK